MQGLTNSQIQSGAYALILAEERWGSPHTYHCWDVGSPVYCDRFGTHHASRPLTHDLFATFAQAFGVRLCEVFIYKFEDGVFYSELLLRMV